MRLVAILVTCGFATSESVLVNKEKGKVKFHARIQRTTAFEKEFLNEQAFNLIPKAMPQEEIDAYEMVEAKSDQDLENF